MQQSASAFRLPATGFRRRFSSSLEHARGTLLTYGQLEGRVTVELYGTSWTDIMVVILDSSYVFLPPREQSLTPGTHFSHLGPRRRH